VINQEGHKINVFAIAISPDGDKVLSGSSDGELSLWSFHDSEVISTFKIFRGLITAIQFFPDGKRAVVSSHDGTVRIFDTATGEPLKTLWLNIGKIQDLALTSDLRSIILTTWCGTGMITKVDLADETQSWSREFGLPIKQIALSSSSQLISAVTFDRIRILKAIDGSDIKDLLSPMLGAVCIFEMYTTLFGPEDKYVVGASQDRAIYCWDWRTGKIERKFRGHKGIITGVALNDGGEFLYSVSEDARLRVWDFLSADIVATFTVDGPICSCAVSPTGDKIVLGEQSGKVHFVTFHR
jgi:WD40 repeat protein